MKKRKILYLIISFLILFSIIIESAYKTDDYLKNLKNIICIFYPIAYYGIYNLLITRKETKINKYVLLFSLLMSTVLLVEYYIDTYDSIRYLYISYIQIIKNIFSFIGYSYMFYFLIDYILIGIKQIKYKKANNKIIKFIFEDHPFISSFIIILICYIPIMYIYYPGVLMNDGADVIRAYYCHSTFSTNYINLINPNVCINTHHSAFYSYIVGFIYNIFNNLGYPIIGLFALTFIQVILQIVILSYTIKLLKKLKTNYIVRTIILFIFSIIPFFSINAVGIFKDIPFSFFCLLLTDFLIEYVYLKEKTKKKIIEILLCSFIVALLSNKGFYIIILVLLSLIISEFKNIKWKSIVFIIPIIIYILYSSILLPTLDVTKGSVREMLAIPIQQVARYVVYYEDDLTEEDKEIIGNIIDYDIIKEKYNPTFADSIKNKYFNKDYTDEEMSDFIKLWIKLFFKHPGVYISAYTHQVIGNFNIYRAPNIVFWNSTTVKYEPIVDNLIEESKFSHPTLANYYQKIWKLIIILPVISIFFKISTYCWTILFILFYFIIKKKNIIPLIPSLVVFLFLFISPVVSMRYIDAIIYCMPILFCFIISLSNEKGKFKSEKE